MGKQWMPRIYDRRIYALIGFFLGIGAPLGWLVCRMFITQQAWLFSWFKSELSQFHFLYFYMTTGTVIAFSIFGYFLGKRSDAVTDESRSVKSTLEQVNVLAVTDALTGLHNARYLHDHVNLEMESAQRYETPVTCLMLDIDDFKSINDTHGHPFGDVVLTTLAKVLQQCVRRVDIVGRLGGEEFLVIMPHTSSATAFQIAERIRRAIENWPFALSDRKISVTVSIGVAYYPSANVNDKGSLLKAADDALYQAKRAGKNQTVMANGGVSIPQFVHHQ